MTCSCLKPVQIAFAGCGNVLGAYLAIAEQLEKRGLSHVAAVCGSEKHRRRVQEELKIPLFYGNYEEMIKNPDIGLIVILTPMQLHAPMAKAALLAGKHVVMEKPLAVHLSEGSELVSIAKERGLLLACAPFTVLSPTFQTIHNRIRRGEIGRLVSARGRYGWAGPDWADWFYKPGGGALFDLGVYNLTTLTGLLGPARRVMSMAGTAIPERKIQSCIVPVEAEDNIHVLIDFGCNCFANIVTGFTIQQYRGPGLELYGTEGTINLLGDDWDPDGYELWQNSAGCWQFFKETQPDWPWADGLRHAVECIHGRNQLAVTPEHAYHVLEIMIKAQVSSKTGQVQSIESSFPEISFGEKSECFVAHRVHDRTRKE